MKEAEEEASPSSEHYEALSVFCNRYIPARADNATDLFSSREIQRLIKEHVGVDMEITEICELLINMNYKYRLEEDNFMWMTKKED